MIPGARTVARLDDTSDAAGTSIPQEVPARLDQASAIDLAHPNASLDIIQRWLGNR